MSDVTLLAENQSECSHTPGPWSCQQVWPGHETKVHAEVDGRPVALAEVFTMRGFREKEANSRLIAAGPELLALARKYASECIECGGSAEGIRGHGPGPEDEYAEPCEACAHIWAVINKAEGKS